MAVRVSTDGDLVSKGDWWDDESHEVRVIGDGGRHDGLDCVWKDHCVHLTCITCRAEFFLEEALTLIDFMFIQNWHRFEVKP